MLNEENNNEQQSNTHQSFENKTKSDFQKQSYEDGVYNGKPLYQTESVSQESKRTQEKKSKGFLTGLFGGVVGAGLVSIALVVALNTGAVGNGTGTTTQPPIKGDAGIDNTSTTVLNAKQVETETTQVVKKVSNSVVGVVNIQSMSQNSLFGSQYSQYHQRQNADTELEAGIGSGVIYKKEGNYAYIVTNHHVVDGATKLDISLSDGTRVEAELLGSDIYTDLAVLRIPADKVTNVATFGSSAAVQVGEPSIAIGNPLDLTFSGTVTQGVISGVERTIDIDLDENGSYDWQVEVLQTDAAINPGNSGGALMNLNGEVIGINSMKINQTSVEGIGFAIPIDIAKPVIESIEKHGEVIRPYMGISLRSVAELNQYQQQSILKLPKDVTTGIAIIETIQGSAADKAGLKAYDVIYEMDGTPVETVIDLRKVLYRSQVGDQITVKYYRDGKSQSTNITLIASES